MSNIGYLFGKKGPSGYGSGSKANDIARDLKENITGKVCIITGCNSGIGRETVQALSMQGMKVIMACRNLEKCNNTIQELQHKSKVPLDLIPMTCDLSSFASIRSFAAAFIELNLSLHVLINNAGVMFGPLTYTVDGHENQFGTNYLGHFLLTELLVPKLIESAPSRVIHLSSFAHKWCPPEGIRFDDLRSEKSYDPAQAYGQSKLANLLHAKDLNERVSSQNVTAHAVHPGVIASELQRHMGFKGVLWNNVCRPFHKSKQQGAATTIYVASCPDLVGGHYFADCNIAKTLTPLAENDKLRKKLRETSLQLCDVQGFPPPGST